MNHLLIVQQHMIGWTKGLRIFGDLSIIICYHLPLDMACKT